MKFKLLREGVERDSLGNVLSDEQVKYFKNSKIRDRQGNLLVVHHGTFSSFNQFDKGDIGFHFGTEKAAKERQDFTDPDRIIKKEWRIGQYYLNITNFLDMYDIGDWDGSNLASHIIESRLLPLTDEEIRYLQQIQMMGGLGMGRNHDPTSMLREFLLKKGIDGIMYENAYEDDGSISYVALNPEQIKSITNKTPTSSKNLNEDAAHYTSDSLSFSIFKSKLISLFNTVGDDLPNYLGAPLQDTIDPESALYILPNGKILSTKEAGIAVLEDDCLDSHSQIIHLLGWKLLNSLLPSEEDSGDWLGDHGEEYETLLDKLYPELTTKYEWARLNCGNTWVEDRFYCVLPTKMSSSQYSTLLDWLEWGESNDVSEVLIYIGDGTQSKVYSFKEYYSEDILKKIKRFYSSGVFYENLSEKVFSNKEVVTTLSKKWKQYMSQMGITAKEARQYVLDKYDDEDIQKIVDFVSSLTFPLKVYRGLTSYNKNGDFKVNTVKPGLHWTVDPKLFTASNSSFRNVTHILTGYVDEEDIDWGNTIDTFAYYSLNPSYGRYPEMEILLKRGAVPKDIKEITREDLLTENLQMFTESLQRLSSNAFITDSPYQIRDLLINKPKLYRILYDSNIDMYMIGDGNEVIHWDLIRAARKLGYYAEMESFIDELGDLDNYVEFGGGGQFLDDEEIESYLIYMVFSPDDEEFILGEDGYQFKYPLSNGVMFTRDSYLEDCDLYRVLKSMMPVSLTEARKDFSDKYPSVDEAQEYINNNYITDTLPPTGATFLMPNGLFIDLGASHMTVHQEFDEQVYNDLVEGGDYVGEFGYTDLFLPRLGFIRCNDGTTMGSLLVHLPSQKPTREQYEALEGWLDASLSMDMYNYIIIATDKSTKRYDTGDYMTDELIALIKRYYASGRLYEDDNTDTTPNEATKVSKVGTDAEPTPQDKAQEIKDNIKVLLTENS